MCAVSVGVVVRAGVGGPVSPCEFRFTQLHLVAE